MHWPQTGGTQYHAKVGPTDKGRAIKYSMASIYDIWDGSSDKRKVHDLVPCFYQDGSIELK